MLVWISKICIYESPYNITGIIVSANPKQKPTDICKDMIIGTRKGIMRLVC